MNFLSVLYARAGITVDGVTTLNNTATGLTPATNDNSTKLATTGYVKNQNYYPYPTGTTSQYVRGDGSLATFTQTGGGGSSVSYYLNGSVSQGTIGGNTYYEMSKTAIVGINTDFSINANGYVAQFVTDAGDPALLNIPGGNWNFEMWFSASSGGGSPKFYVELYKYDGTTLTLIASGSAVPESITGGTATDLYVTALAVPTTTLTLTDRLAIRVYVLNSGRTITLHTQNGHLCQIITTFTTGLTALNGLTAQVQNFAVGAGGSDFNISSVVDTHTFNLPTASATKRGALSSIDWSAFDAKVDFGDLSATAPLNYNGSGLFTIAQSSGSTNGYLSSTDWTTFNAKIGGSGTANYVAKFTSGSAVNNSIIYDNGYVGIGTTTPATKLQVVGGYISTKDDATYGGAFMEGANDVVYFGSLGNDVISLYSGGAIKLQIKSNGNTLIGTTTDAGYKLDVNGTARVSGAATFKDYVSVPSATANGFYKLLSTSASASSREYRIYSDGYNYGDLVIDKATTQGGSTYSLQFILNSGNLTLGSIPNIGSGSLFAGAASFNGAVNATSFTASNRTILTAGGVYDNATNGNNIGIGFGAGVIISTNGSGTYSAQNIGNATYPWYSANFVSTITASQGLFTSGSSLAGVIVKGSSSNQGVLQFGDANTNFQIQGGVDYSGMLFKVGSVERMRIVLSSGNVLINTTTDAGYKLYVNGDAYLGAAYFSGTYSTFNSSYFTVNSSESVIGNNTSDIVGIAGNTMYFPGNGNVGIGTTSPSAKFEIDKTANNTISQTNANFFFGSKTLDIGLLGQQLLSAPYSYVLQAGVQAMTVFTPISLNPLGGNVLIGTTTDAGYKLDVNGTARLNSNVTIGNGTTTTSKLTILATTGVVAPGSPTLGIYDEASPTFGFDFSLEGVATGDLYLSRLVAGTRTSVLQIARATGAATFSSSVTASSLIKSGGTAAQFLKADGSVDSNTYVTSGALAAYLPLAGGTLTGALNGTSGTFSGNLDSSGKYAATSNQTSPSDGSAYFYKSSSGAVVSGFQFIAETGGAGSRGTRLTIDNTGAATFSSTISLTGALTINNGSIDNKLAGFTYYQVGLDGSANYKIYNSNYGRADLVITQSTGAATFSSSVTASSLIKSGGTSTQYLMADGSVSTLTNPVTGSGTIGYIPKFTGASALGDSVIYQGGSNIGIGETNPISYPLQVKGADGQGIQYEDANGVRTLLGSYLSKAIIGTLTNHAVGFWSNNSEKITLTASGNVGIGTASPSSILQLGAGSSITTNASYKSFQAGGFGVLFRDAYDAYITFNTTYSPSGWLNKYDSLKSGIIQITDGKFSVDLGTGVGAGVASSLIERFVILNNGYVGINTTTPSVALHVIGDIAVGATPYNGGLYASSSASGSDLNWGFQIKNTPSTDDYSVRLKYYPVTGGDRKGGIYNSRNEDWILYGDSNNTPNVIIPSGNVGIGTTAPAFTLDVVGLSRTKRTGVNGAGLAGVIVLATDAKTIGDGQSLAFQGHNSSNAETTYGNIYTTIVSPTASAHSSSMTFKVYNSASGVDALTLASTGAATLSSLAGTGSRMVVADASGVLSTQAIPGGVSGSGTTDYLPKWTGTSDLGDSLLQEGTSAIGLGVTPSAWDTSFKALQIGVGTSLYNNSSANGTFLGSNLYYDGTNNRYIATGTANAYGQTSGEHKWFIAASGTAGDVITFTQSMTLTASGQLGIGTTTPATALDVVLGAYSNTTAKFGAGIPIYIINNDPHIGFNTYYDSGWKYGAGSSSNFAGALGCAQTTGDFTLQTSTTGGNAGNTATFVALMTWKQNGNIGIGTNVPSAKLHVVGKGIFNNNVRIYPTSESWAEGLAFIMPTTSTWGGLRWQRERVNDNGNWYLGFTALDSSDDLVFGANNGGSQVDNIIRLTKAGNVGIGTSSPQGKLSVDGGDIRFNSGNAAANYYVSLNHNSSNDGGIIWARNNTPDWQMVNATSGDFWMYSYGTATVAFMLQRATGNVGIGTNAPEFKLDVVGGNARINGVMVGKGSNSVSTNLGVGVNPLYSNTSGSENTAIGYFAMYSTTSAIRNTALGNNALYSNLTGASNVAIGVGSLYSNIDGRYNSSVGYNSMQFMRGEYNSALGRDSMRGSLTAANNTGQYNTAVGYESMLVFTSGERNTSIGFGTGGSLTTGSRNTFVGSGASQAAGNIVTTGNNNTIIGGYGGTTTLSDTVVLADGAGQVQLWATGKNVAFGTTSPTTYANYTTLHIAGQTTTAGGVLRLTTSDSSIAVNIFTNNAGANYDTTTSHSHLFNINGASSLIVSSSGIETAGSITTADPGLGAAAWQLGDVQNATVSLITSQYVEVVIGGSSYQLALVQLE